MVRRDYFCCFATSLKKCLLDTILLLEHCQNVADVYVQLLFISKSANFSSDKWCLNGPYNNLTWLSGDKGEQLDDLDPDSDDYAALKVGNQC